MDGHVEVDLGGEPLAQRMWSEAQSRHDAGPGGETAAGAFRPLDGPFGRHHVNARDRIPAKRKLQVRQVPKPLERLGATGFLVTDHDTEVPCDDGLKSG